MEVSVSKESSAKMAMNYNKKEELKAFDDSKAGVKGIIDAGVGKVPKIFIRPPDELAEELDSSNSNLQIPVIDLSRIEGIDGREKVVNEIRTTLEEWGFFQVVNHGIPLKVLDEMIDGIRMFHEQDTEIKKALYSRDRLKRVRYETNYDLYKSKYANWRDTLTMYMLVSDPPYPDEIPPASKSIIIEYTKHASNLGNTLFELLSEALGLKPEHLNALKCGRDRVLLGHYYPACPEPELTLGSSKHLDPTFLTVLLQDQLGGLQVMYKNQWVDVQPISGALVVNIGVLLEIITNGKFKGADHRVVANLVGPRISVACFFMGCLFPPRVYSPIKELISEENPGIYKDFVVSDYMKNFFSKALDKSVLNNFKL